MTTVDVSENAALKHLSTRHGNIDTLLLNPGLLSLDASVCPSAGRMEEYVSGNEAASIEIYPNPAKEVVTVRSKFGVHSVVIRNIKGEELLKSEGKNTFSIAVLPSGLYFAEITTENGTEIHKLIVR